MVLYSCINYAHACRYATLWTHGGIYIDIDATCKRLRDIILPADTAILSYGGKWHRKFCSWDREIDQWVLMFAPKHPFLKRAMMVAAARVLDPSKLGKEIANMHQHVLETTGPILLKNAVECVSPAYSLPHTLLRVAV
jgi:mannosyltransferase OCH1-like enzyme